MEAREETNAVKEDRGCQVKYVKKEKHEVGVEREQKGRRWWGGGILVKGG